MGSAYRGSPLEMAILQQSIEEYRKIRIQQGLNAYAEGHASLSLGLLQEVLSADQSQLHTGFFLAHMQRELGLFPEAISTLDETLRLVDHDSIRADLFCTLGDAYSQGGDSLQARAAYMKCIQADSLFNFRAVLDLGGT
jgi:Flp pilus assembly protein TadD